MRGMRRMSQERLRFLETCEERSSHLLLEGRPPKSRLGRLAQDVSGR